MPVFLEIPGFGLSNRIRTVLAFDYIAKKQHRGPVYVYWLVNHMCPDHFNNLFQDIPGVIFIKDLGEFKRLRNQRGGIYYKGQAQFHGLVNRYTKANVDGAVKPRGNSQSIYDQQYLLLKPLPAIWQDIQSFIETNQIKNRIGLHIRRTDHVSFIKRVKGRFDNDEHFEKIIRRDPTQLFYLSTDNLDTQKKFLNKFPNQLVVYSAIPDVKSIRKTTVVHAVIDLFLLGNCKQVQGSFGSSFSEFAYRLSSIWSKSDKSIVSSVPVVSVPKTETKTEKKPKKKSKKHKNRKKGRLSVIYFPAKKR